MRLHLLLISLFLCLSSHMETKAACQLSKWISEDASGKAQVTCTDGTLDIVSPDGLSLWYKERLTGNYEISYRAKVIMEHGASDRLSDLNCFWGASDPQHPDDFFARSDWRKGIFQNYNTLNLFYVGYGGNDNKTTRFRRYHGEYYGTDDAKVKPLLKEYTDQAHLLKPNHWYDIRIRVENDVTTYTIDGEELFRQTISSGEGDGYFALRLWQNHVSLADFRVSPLKEEPQAVTDERLLSFEEPQVPAFISGTASRLSISDEHFRAGSHSLCWDYEPEAVLSIRKDLKFEKKDPTGKDTYLSAFIVWVYNEQAQDKQIEFQFLKDGKKCASFPFRHQLHRLARGVGVLRTQHARHSRGRDE